MTSLLKFKIQRSLLTLRQLSQSMDKIEFSNTAENRSNPVSYSACLMIDTLKFYMLIIHYAVSIPVLSKHQSFLYRSSDTQGLQISATFLTACVVSLQITDISFFVCDLVAMIIAFSFVEKSPNILDRNLPL